jgi:hypothetical protein
MNKKKALILLSTVVVAAVIGGIVLNACSTTAKACTMINNNGDAQGWYGWKGWGFVGPTISNITVVKPAICRGWMYRHGYRGFVEVSEEFKENVINIAKNDTDVQKLLNEGYNITYVRPIVKAIVEKDGTIITKATSAILMLQKNTTGRAAVTVDVENAKVTKIVILTKTVIQKP